MIDCIDESGCFSCYINRPDGRLRRAFTPADSVQDVINFLTENAPDYDYNEEIKVINEIWTDEKITQYKNKIALLDAESAELIRIQEQENQAKQELLWAEEQAHIENVVRDLMNVK